MVEGVLCDVSGLIKPIPLQQYLEETMSRLWICAVFFATPVLADPDGYGHMSAWGSGVGMMFGPILWIIVLGLVVAGVIFFVRRMDDNGPQRGKPDAVAELDLRLARGEIDADDYSARKKLLMENR
jgi:putative membrane protein